MKSFAIVLTMVALAVAPATWAQKADAPKADAPAAQAQAAEESLTGCLGGEERTFTLKTSTGSVQLEGRGLESHVGKTVRVTGTRATAAGKSTFKVTNIEVVSPNCQA